MSALSNQLRLALQENNLSQSELSERTGVSQAQISRYLAGDPPHRPPPEMFELMVENLPESRRQLVTAYIEDELTPKLRARYQITERSTGNRVREEATVRPQAFRARMPKELREAYDRVGAAAIERDAVAKTIINLAGFLPE